MLLPLPDFFGEFLATEIMARFAFGVDQALHDHLRRNTGVIGTNLP